MIPRKISKFDERLISSILFGPMWFLQLNHTCMVFLSAFPNPTLGYRGHNLRRNLIGDSVSHTTPAMSFQKFLLTGYAYNLICFNLYWLDLLHSFPDCLRWKTPLFSPFFDAKTVFYSFIFTVCTSRKMVNTIFCFNRTLTTVAIK